MLPTIPLPAFLTKTPAIRFLSPPLQRNDSFQSHQWLAHCKPNTSFSVYHHIRPMSSNLHKCSISSLQAFSAFGLQDLPFLCFCFLTDHFFPVSFIFWVSKCFSLVYIHLLPRWSLTRPLTTTDNTPIYISSQDLCSRRQARISNRLLGISTWISTRPLKLPCLKLNSLSPPQSALPECSPAQEIQPAFF